MFPFIIWWISPFVFLSVTDVMFLRDLNYFREAYFWLCCWGLHRLLSSFICFYFSYFVIPIFWTNNLKCYLEHWCWTYFVCLNKKSDRHNNKGVVQKAIFVASVFFYKNFVAEGEKEVIESHFLMNVICDRPLDRVTSEFFLCRHFFGSALRFILSSLKWQNFKNRGTNKMVSLPMD